MICQVQKTKAEKIVSLRHKNEILAEEVKEKEAHLKEYIELFKLKAKGKLPNEQIAKVLEEVEAMRTDDESSDSDSDSDLDLN